MHKKTAVISRRLAHSDYIYALMKSCDSRYSKCLYFASSALSRKVEKLASECWQPAGLSPSHGYLLMLAIEEPGVHPSALGEQLQLTPSTITRLIEKLEEKQLVLRISEGKATSVFATPKGKDMLDLLKDCSHQFYVKYSQILGEEKSAALTASMCSVADQLG